MDHFTVKRLALVLATQAEIGGMKADNLLRKQNGQTPAYAGAAFSDMAKQLENLAHVLDDQL